MSLIDKFKNKSKLPLGYYYTSMWLEIDISKVCDDHPDSDCMRGRCMECSYTACKLLKLKG